MKIVISTDLEGSAGIFHREMQISRPTPQEFARTLRLATREVVAAIEGARSAGATEILIDALHDIDMELLPGGVQVIRGIGFWDVRYYEKEHFDALLIVGQHGGAHLTDCALAHTFLPSWQIEAAERPGRGLAQADRAAVGGGAGRRVLHGGEGLAERPAGGREQLHRHAGGGLRRAHRLHLRRLSRLRGGAGDGRRRWARCRSSGASTSGRRGCSPRPLPSRPSARAWPPA